MRVRRVHGGGNVEGGAWRMSDYIIVTWLSELDSLSIYSTFMTVRSQVQSRKRGIWSIHLDHLTPQILCSCGAATDLRFHPSSTLLNVENYTNRLPRWHPSPPSTSTVLELLSQVQVLHDGSRFIIAFRIFYTSFFPLLPLRHKTLKS